MGVSRGNQYFLIINLIINWVLHLYLFLSNKVCNVQPRLIVVVLPFLKIWLSTRLYYFFGSRFDDLTKLYYFQIKINFIRWFDKICIFFFRSRSTSFDDYRDRERGLGKKAKKGRRSRSRSRSFTPPKKRKHGHHHHK